MFKWTFKSNKNSFFYTILILSENVAYVVRLLKEGRGEGRGSECDIGKKKLSIVPPPPDKYSISDDWSPHSSRWKSCDLPLPPPSPKNPFLTPLVESTFGGIYDYQFEQWWIFRSLSLKRSLSKKWWFLDIFWTKPEQKVKVKYIPVFLIHSRVPCRFLLFYYPFTNFSMNLARMHTCSTNRLPDYRSFSCGATHFQIHAVLLE